LKAIYYAARRCGKPAVLLRITPRGAKKNRPSGGDPACPGKEKWYMNVD